MTWNFVGSLAIARRDRNRVRAFVGHSLHFSNGRANGNSATGRSEHSNDFHHVQRRRTTLRRLAPEARSADRPSSLVTGFERMPRSM
jgi:hypothetical protein